MLRNCDVESLLRRAKEIPLLYTSSANRKKGEAKSGGLKDSTWQQQPAAAANQELSYIIAQEQDGCDEKLFTTLLCAISISWVVFLFFFARPSFSLLYTRTRSRMLGLYMPAGETPAQRSNKTTTSELGYLACWAKAAELVQQQQQHLVLAKQNPTIV